VIKESDPLLELALSMLEEYTLSDTDATDLYFIPSETLDYED
jgi:hypothetical protein